MHATDRAPMTHVIREILDYQENAPTDAQTTAYQNALKAIARHFPEMFAPRDQHRIRTEW